MDTYTLLSMDLSSLMASTWYLLPGSASQCLQRFCRLGIQPQLPRLRHRTTPTNPTIDEVLSAHI